MEYLKTQIIVMTKMKHHIFMVTIKKIFQKDMVTILKIQLKLKVMVGIKII